MLKKGAGCLLPVGLALAGLFVVVAIQGGPGFGGFYVAAAVVAAGAGYLSYKGWA